VSRGLERVEALSESGLGDGDKAGATRPSQGLPRSDEYLVTCTSPSKMIHHEF
jgi:hypothetical protein